VKMSNDVPFAEVVVVGEAATEAALSGARLAAEVPGARVAHRFGPNVAILVGDESDEPQRSTTDLSTVDLAALTPTERLGVQAAALRQSAEWQEAKRNRPRQGEEWDMQGRCVDSGEEESAAALDAGAPGLNDYLEGSVAVGVVIVDGPTADLQFSNAENIKIVAEIQAGLSFLAGVNPNAGLTFFYDTQFPSIDVPANPGLPAEDLEKHWREPTLAAIGATSSGDYARRIKQNLGTQWAYVVYFIKYPAKHFGYASGDRIVMQYPVGNWHVDDTDRVFAHETGHIFGAPDEYKDSGCTCGGAHGRFGEPNDNCESCAGTRKCIMKYNDFAMCKYTYRHLGWRSPIKPGTAGWVTSVSSRDDRLDAFAVDEDGAIRWAFWQPGMAEWFQGWIDVLGGVAAQGSQVTAVSRRPGYLDLFVIGKDGQVWTAARNSNGDWWGWAPIPGVTVPQRGYVHAVSRSKDKLDIFVTDTKGRVMSAAWAPSHPNQAWHGWWHILGGIAGNGSVVHAISRSTDQLDIFVIGTDKRIYTAAWHPTHPNGVWHGWWDINGGQALVGAAITGVARNKDLLDIFMNGLDGRPWTAGWSPANPDGKWGGWWQIGP
jgi:hypothetical protein